MLMSAPLGFGWPGYIARLSDQNKDMRLNRNYHWYGLEWLDETLSVSCPVIRQDKDTHVKVGLNKGRFTDWNIDCWVDRVSVCGAFVLKNGQIDEASEISIRGQRADPCSY